MFDFPLDFPVYCKIVLEYQVIYMNIIYFIFFFYHLHSSPSTGILRSHDVTSSVGRALHYLFGHLSRIRVVTCSSHSFVSFVMISCRDQMTFESSYWSDGLNVAIGNSRRAYSSEK